jgi:hypothetical protein
LLADLPKSFLDSALTLPAKEDLDEEINLASNGRFCEFSDLIFSNVPILSIRHSTCDFQHGSFCYVGE